MRFESGPLAATRNSFSSSAETLLSLLRRLTATIPPHRERERERETDREQDREREREELHSEHCRYNGREGKSVRENESFFAVYSSRSRLEEWGGVLASTIESIERGPLPLFLSCFSKGEAWHKGNDE